jgi:transposase
MNVDFTGKLHDLDQEIAIKDKAIAAVLVLAAQDPSSPQEAIRLATADLNAERAALATKRAEVAAWQAENAEQKEYAEGLQRLADTASWRLKAPSPTEKAEILTLMDIKVTLLEPVPDTLGGPCPVAQWFRANGKAIPELTEAGWLAAEPVIRARHKPDKRLLPRTVLEALLFKARHEARWPELKSYGLPVSIRTVWSRWFKNGLWAEIIEALREEPSTSAPTFRVFPPMRLEGVIFPGLLLPHGEYHEGTPPFGRAVVPDV